MPWDRKQGWDLKINYHHQQRAIQYLRNNETRKANSSYTMACICTLLELNKYKMSCKVQNTTSMNNCCDLIHNYIKLTIIYNNNTFDSQNQTY